MMDSMFEVVVVGMRFYDVKPQDATEYMEYRLVPEPDNAFDARAIKVFGIGAQGQRFVGHVSRTSLHGIPTLQASGEVFRCVYAYLESAQAVNLKLKRNN